MKPFIALIKREYWEHKGGILRAPMIMALIFASLMVVGTLATGSIQVNDNSLSFGDAAPMAAEKFEVLTESKKDAFVQGLLYSPVALFGGVMLIISLFYALGCLYDERKDRSILFWKSLPVSDTETVLSKFAIITLVFPAFYFVIIAAFQLFLLLFATVGMWFGGSSGIEIWTSSNWIAVLFNTLFALIMGSLWIAPLWGWFMLASVWAKRVAFLWATLPFVVIAAVEGYFLRTTNFIEMIGNRIVNGFAIQNSNLNAIARDGMFDENSLFWTEAITSGEFWVGLVIAAVFLAVTIYTRRFKDES